MSKFVLFIISFILVFSLCGCKNTEYKDEKEINCYNKRN